jgi:diaminopimelate decarboxylase
MHIGSQITELQPFDDALKLLTELVGQLRADGHTIDHIDLGGGLGIPTANDNAIRRPCRTLMADRQEAHLVRSWLQGDLRARPHDRRQCRHPHHGSHLRQGWRTTKSFVIVDAAMNDLIRPTLYEAWHEISSRCASRSRVRRASAPISSARSANRGDFLAKDREMASARAAGDLLALRFGRRLWRGAGGYLQHDGCSSRR